MAHQVFPPRTSLNYICHHPVGTLKQTARILKHSNQLIYRRKDHLFGAATKTSYAVSPIVTNISVSYTTRQQLSITHALKNI